MAFDSQTWPPDYKAVYAERLERFRYIKQGKIFADAVLYYYSDKPEEFIEHWGVTFDPRNSSPLVNLPTKLPFIPFKRQKELIQFVHACYTGQASGLIEKVRDAGATWICVGYSVWLWLFHDGATIGWGSRKKELVDNLGDPKSIFHKIRQFISLLPSEFLPQGFYPKKHMTSMKVINPANEATIIGEVGDNIGRGGRTSIYFKDESAHYEHAEAIEAALGDNTNVMIDISSVNGLGNVFHRRRESGKEWAPGGELVYDKTNIFIFDVFDHPAKTRAWYDAKKEKARNDGLLHVFAQETDRNYAASVIGVIIPAEWIASAIDAHLNPELGINFGPWSAGLDVADEGEGDKNALVARSGVVLLHADEWGGMDTGQTARKAMDFAIELNRPLRIEYDCIGVGTGVKSEVNRIDRESPEKMPKGLTFSPWDAGAAVKDKEEHLDPFDDETPTNEDAFENLKAQGWWMLRRRFEKTHRAITEGIKFPPSELISLPSDLPNLQTIRKELSQPTSARSGSMRIMVNKTPKGTKSPNLGDAVMMCYWPSDATFDVDEYTAAMMGTT